MMPVLLGMVFGVGAQIPWPRVFVEGVVIVGDVEN